MVYDASMFVSCKWGISGGSTLQPLAEKSPQKNDSVFDHLHGFHLEF